MAGNAGLSMSVLDDIADILNLNIISSDIKEIRNKSHKTKGRK